MKLQSPSNYLFSQNYPNPFNPTTAISYELPEANYVSIKVYNLIGKEVAVLVDEQKQAGKYKLQFDGSGIPSGVYFYRIQAGSYSETKRMILLK